MRPSNAYTQVPTNRAKDWRDSGSQATFVSTLLLTIEPKHAKNINNIDTASKSVGLSSKHSMHYRRYSDSSDLTRV